MHKHSSRLSPAARAAAVLCLCLLPVLAGCSRVKVVPVQGKLTLTDGKPTPTGHVIFVPLEQDPNVPRSVLPPEGQIEEGGAYTLFWNGKPGAPVGKYRVVFQRSPDARWVVFPTEYFNPEKSPLEVEVVENKPEGGYDLTVQPRGRQSRNGQGDALAILGLKDKRLKEKQLKDKQ